MNPPPEKFELGRWLLTSLFPAVVAGLLGLSIASSLIRIFQSCTGG